MRLLNSLYEVSFHLLLITSANRQFYFSQQHLIFINRLNLFRINKIGLVNAQRKYAENRGGSDIQQTTQLGDLQIFKRNIILGLNISNND